ncbi:hypothetical protein [Pseudobacter ginsenosidimutans]|nr:hypothetical protein [Pseudobacter ginsenosidimutans]QEC45658.1 hypothetical protein FSB84_29685 [Pseudobacter ginsenosidimutans]
MKHHTRTITVTRILFGCLLAASLATSCRKEKMPAPSGLDEDYFVVQDDPNDPVQHARYEFYKSTGIASFYNDTIKKKQVGEVDGKPRYTYYTLSMVYGLYGGAYTGYKLVSDKTQIPAFLDLLKTDFLPRLPDAIHFPSILMLDSIYNSGFPALNVQIADGWTSMQGFNTTGFCVKNVTAMSNDEKRVYIASLLAGIAEKRLNDLNAERLQDEFFSISRAVSNSIIPAWDIYFGIAFIFLYPAGNQPAAHTLGILKYPRVKLGEAPPMNDLVSMPRAPDDLRAYLTAALCYTEEEFTSLYTGNELILKKFSVIRNMVREAGFKLPG